MDANACASVIRRWNFGIHKLPMHARRAQKTALNFIFETSQQMSSFFVSKKSRTYEPLLEETISSCYSKRNRRRTKRRMDCDCDFWGNLCWTRHTPNGHKPRVHRHLLCLPTYRTLTWNPAEGFARWTPVSCTFCGLSTSSGVILVFAVTKNA